MNTGWSFKINHASQIRKNRDFSALGTPENKADFKYVIQDAQKSKHPDCSVFHTNFL